MKTLLKVQLPSKTFKGDYHTVEVYEDGSMKCDCVRAGYYHMECRHIKKIKKLINSAGKKNNTKDN